MKTQFYLKYERAIFYITVVGGSILSLFIWNIQNW